MSKKPIRTFVLDFETTTNQSAYYLKHKKVTIILGIIKEIDQPEKLVTSAAETIDYLLSLADDNNKANIEIWVHNLGFDVTFLYEYLFSAKCKLNYLVEGDTNFNRNVQDTWTTFATSKPNKIYSLTITYNNCKIVFKDSYNYYTSSLDAIGRDFGIAKQTATIDSYHKYEPQANVDALRAKYPDYIRYCIYDCLILEKAIKEGKEQELITNKLTISSKAWDNSIVHAVEYGARTLKQSSGMSRKAFKRNFECLTVAEYDKGKNFVRGGFVSTSPMHTNVWIKQELHYVDVSSAYTYHATQPIPIKGILDKRELTNKIRLDKHFKYTTWLIIHINKADMYDCDYPPIIQDKGGRIRATYAQHLVNKTVYVNKEEWEFWLKAYKMDYYLLEEYYQELAVTSIKEFMEFNYAAKTKYKKEGKKVLALESKTNCNGWVGKTGQAPLMDTIIFGRCIEGECPLFGYKAHIQWPCEDGHFMHRERVTAKENLDKPIKARNVYTNAYICMRQRLKLQRHIFEHEPHWFVYCDTDSITHFPTSEIKHGHKLGEWELEWIFYEAKFIQAKTYLATVAKQPGGPIIGSREHPAKITCAGFRQKDKYLNYYTFNSNHLFAKANIKKHVIPSGTYLDDVDYKLGG